MGTDRDNPEALLARCAWPPLDEPFAEALKKAVSAILSRLDPVGIVATGTIVRGEAGPTSDLDLYVIHTQPKRQRLQKRFNGVPAEIFVNPPAAIERYIKEERRFTRPLTAHMLATGFVVLDRHPVVTELIRRARQELDAGPGPSDLQLTRVRYGIVCLYEDAVDVREHDPENAFLILTQAVERALQYPFWVSGRWLPRQKRLLRVLAEEQPDLVEKARTFFRDPDLDRRFVLARDILLSTVGLDCFFEWDGPLEDVP